ncbi:transcription antitermination factor NusB, partial [Tessaracoccus lubricantis]
MNPRRVAFDVLRQITGEHAYANLALAKRLATAGLDTRDAGLVTELVSGTCRLMGTYDRVIEAAAGRELGSLQPAVVDLLRLGAHQLLGMRMKKYAAVTSTVDLARATVGQRVTGLVNAIMRKISARDLDGWLDELSRGADALDELAIRGHHPRWIVDAYAELLTPDELPRALAANNEAPHPTLVVRPGLATIDDLEGAVATRFSPFGATTAGAPAEQAPVR